MAWTTPKTDWNTGELVTAADLNAIGANLALLRYSSTAVAAYTTPEDINNPTNNEFTDVDSINLSLTITTGGGDVLVHFDGVVQRGEGRNTENSFDFVVDGIRQGNENGLIRTHVQIPRLNQSFTRLIQNLSAGPHTFKLQWKNGSSVRLFAGAQFWVREI